MILREEDDGGRVVVMSDDERVRPGERTEIRLWRCRLSDFGPPAWGLPTLAVTNKIIQPLMASIL